MSHIPAQALSLVLQHVPSSDRLRSCAFVHTSWHEAVVAITSSIRVSWCYDNEVQSLQRYLHRYGKFANRVALSTDKLSQSRTSCDQEQDQEEPPMPAHMSRSTKLFQLQCGSLLELYMYGITTRLSPLPAGAGGYNGVLADAQQLTSLVLISCSVVQGDSFSSLAAATNLRHLVLDGFYMPETQRYMALPGTALSQLAKVTHLALGAGLLQQDTLQQLSCLKDLRHLCCYCQVWATDGAAGAESAVLTQLQLLSHLTHIDIKRPEWGQMNADTAPGLAKLTALKVFKLWGLNLLGQPPSLDPAVLSSMSGLHHLALQELRLPSAAAAELLRVLPELLELTYLNLNGTLLHEAPSAAAYSALTASSQLQVLRLDRFALPPQSWQHIFNPQRPNRQLQQLVLRDSKSVDEGSIFSADLSRLTACCPSLKTLELVRVCRTGVTLTALQSFTALTGLAVTGVSYENVTELAALTNLSHLSAHEPTHLHNRGLLYLTALRGLTYLSAPDGDHLEGHSNKFQNAAPPGVLPDTWLQLVKGCALRHGCQPFLPRHLVRMAEALAARDTQVVQLQAELAHTRAELAAAQAQLAKLLGASAVLA